MDESTSGEPKTQEPKKLNVGIVWDHFTRLDCKHGENPRVACNYCGMDYACDPKVNGTKLMLTHIESQCKEYPLRQDENQTTTLGFEPKRETVDGETIGDLVATSFSVDACRKALAEMIIIDELPFKFVEGEGFRRFMRVVQPMWLTIPSRITIANGCKSIFVSEKAALKNALRGQRICLPTDTWTSVQNLKYLCLTAHFIDCDWKLNKKILNFRLVPNHRGKTLGRVIEGCLSKWGIDKLLTITVDNASSNNGVINFLKRWTKDRKNTILEHEFLHVKCCAHVLNLIVCESLKEIDDSITRICNIVKYVKSSPSRMAEFKFCVKLEHIEYEGQLCLDVATRWNSTYFMLEQALQFQKVFEQLEDDGNFFHLKFREDEIGEEVGDGGEGVVGANSGKGKEIVNTFRPPTSDDWMKAKLYFKFLKLFYKATLRLSGSLYVTCDAFFTEIMVIQSAITKLCANDDENLQLLARGMSFKFDKYWGRFDKINLLLFVAAVLDPRYKLKYVQWCLEQIYEAKHVEDLVKRLKKELARIYDWYVLHDSIDSVRTQNLGDSSKRITMDEDDDTDVFEKIMSEFKKHLEEESNMVNKSKLERFLMEDCEEDNDNFDILFWWKANSSKYCILSHLARDVLAIPVSTVASGSAFSMGGCVLDPFHSSLSPSMVEALICSQNWLRSPAQINLRDQLDELEKLASEFMEGGETN